VNLVWNIVQEAAWNARVEQATAYTAGVASPENAAQVEQPTLAPLATDTPVLVAADSATSAVAIVPPDTPLPTDTLVPSAVSIPRDTPAPTDIAAEVIAKDARDSLFVNGNASPPLAAGEQGKVAVVAIGKTINSDFGSASVPVVVRNNTPDYVTRIQVSGAARAPDGTLLAAGGDQGITPNLVYPGEVAFGYLYFGDVNLPEGTTFDLATEYEPAGASIEEFENTRDLEVTEVSLVENRIVGLLRNQYGETITGPISIEVACFDPQGQMLGPEDSYADRDTVTAGESIPYQVELYEDCPVYLVTASGYAD
jgi:hypothetical protein